MGDLHGLGGARGLGCGREERQGAGPEILRRQREGREPHLVPTRPTRSQIISRGRPLDLDGVRRGVQHVQRGDRRGRDRVRIRDGSGRVRAPSGNHEARQHGKVVDTREELVLEGPEGRERIARPEERQDPGHVRGGHRGPAEQAVRASRKRAQDIRAGSGEVHRGRPEVGEIGQVVGRRGRGDRYDVVEVVARGVGRKQVVVRGGISSCGHEQDARVHRVLDRQPQRLGKPAAPPAVAHDVDVHHRGVFDRGDGIGRASAAARVQELERHEAHGPVHSRHAEPVVPHGADGARHVGAVEMVVHGVVVAVHEVPAANVVHESVSVVVDVIPGDFRGVDEDVCRQIRMGVIDARIDDGDHDAVAARRDVPCLRRMDVGPGGSAGLTDVVETPEIGKQRVIRLREGRDHVVGLDEFHGRVIAIACDGVGHGPSRDPIVLGMDPAEAADPRGSQIRENGAADRSGDSRLELDDDLPRFHGGLGLDGSWDDGEGERQAEQRDRATENGNGTHGGPPALGAERAV